MRAIEFQGRVFEAMSHATTTPMRRHLRVVRIACLALAAVLASSMTSVAQDEGKGSAADPQQYVANAAEFVEAADWDSAKRVGIVMTENAFTPRDITLEESQPYLFEIFNVAEVAHELIGEDFFRSVATQRAETPESYVIAPYFTAIEVFPGQQAVLSLIPLISGTYDLRRDVAGQPNGEVFGTVTVVGPPELELADVASGPWVQDSASLVEAADWDRQAIVTVELSEFAFTPDGVTLNVGQPYQIEVVNVGEVRHEFTAPGFFSTAALDRAEDASASFKAPAPREVEVFPGETTRLYVIPTATGTFDLVCEIPGHLEAGMFGTITVAA